MRLSRFWWVYGLGFFDLGTMGGGGDSALANGYYYQHYFFHCWRALTSELQYGANQRDVLLGS